ncbi:multi anti extrusion protein MatE [Paenibacillus mucilaginosus 3016]|uniref:Multi anti extrusion protein MatE n=2 Tax=Paenibacillus mucilaginosus TaxID=61624 RepID=H6NHU7_9BACL|nr:multi anti extrusion protein MatE [Paenibacillus mucilaginosus 3016]WFA18816.1 MATE family efflux transporter [Paenibacillus mucilaginosus]
MGESPSVLEAWPDLSGTLFQRYNFRIKTFHDEIFTETAGREALLGACSVRNNGGGKLMAKEMPAKANLTEGPIGRNLLLFALPVLMGNVLQSLNGTINSIWVGNYLGESAFAATSNANNIMFFLLSLVFGIGMASTILIGQSVGAGDEAKAKRVVGTSALFFTSLSIVITAVGMLFSEAILRGMSTPADAMPYAAAYLRIIFLGVPFMFFYNFVMMILRGAGDAKTPFYFLLLSTVLDIVLNPVFIFGLGPLPRMDTAGAALASVIAQLVALVGLVWHLYRRKHFLRLTAADRHLLRFDPQIVGALVKKGIPMGLQMMIVSTSAIAIVQLVNSFGSVATAAFGAAMQISSYVQMPAMAIGGAVSTLAAQNVGAGKWDRVHKTTLLGILFNFVMTGTLVGVIYLFNRQALGLFLQDEAAIAIGMTINHITLWAFILFGITFVVSGVVRATGAVMIPLLTTFLALWCFRVPLAYYLGHAYGLDALWWSFPVGFGVGIVLSSMYYLWGNWRQAKMLEPAAGAPAVE